MIDGAAECPRERKIRCGNTDSEGSSMSAITLTTATKVVDAAIEKAREIGQPMNIAVVDDGGHLVAFARMDGAIKASIDISIKKARTSILMNAPTSALMPLAQPGAELYGLEQTSGGLIIFGGGIPLSVDGVVVGAIGVSAGSVEQDVSVADAGVAAL
ncbi:MAG: GlcG/HbpS family heme-binding protein [Mycobacterium sp.]